MRSVESEVLIINDPLIDRSVVEGILSDFNAAAVPDPASAIRYIKSSPEVDLVIFDAAMEQTDHLDFIRELDSLHISKNIHKIIITDQMEANEDGPDCPVTTDYVRKPVTPALLKSRVKAHLEMIRIQHLLDERTKDSSLTLYTILEQAPMGIVLSYTDLPSWNIGKEPAVINSMFEKITGRSRKELLQLGWAAITHPEDVQKDVKNFNDLIAGRNSGYSMEKRFIKPDGSVVWTDITVAPLKLKNETKYTHICIVQDITARKKTEEHLLESERSKSVLLSNIPGMAYRCSYDPDWTVHFVSAGCFELTGYSPENFHKKEVGLNSITLPKYREMIWNELGKAIKEKIPFRLEYEIMTASGETKWVHETGQGVFDNEGGVVAVEGILIDITKSKKHEQKLKYLSEHDPVTGLHNRTYFKNMFSDMLICGAGVNRAILLLNIKKINSVSLAYGYSYSENTIVELANRLLSITNYNVKLFQISFERLVLYVSGFKRDFDLISICHSIFDMISGNPITNSLGCAIGILKINDSECDPETILKNSAIAADKADRESLFSYCFFDEKLEESVSREAEIKKELLAVSGENPNVYVEYQPIVSLSNGMITGFEALARMKSSILGRVPPLEFIPLAEEMQLIVPLGIKIMKIACDFIRELENEGYRDIGISVNVSAIQLLNIGFVQSVIDIVEETGIDPRNLTIEVTESVFTDNFELINLRLSKLQEMGISVSIDDFGTGYSSLSRERELNVDYIKIDKFFIDKLEHIDLEQAITCDIISMGHKLGHMVVAEGVETEKQKLYLTENGCDFMQGFLFSSPINSSSAIELLKKTNNS